MDAGRRELLLPSIGVCSFQHSLLLACLWGWDAQFLIVHSYGCGLSATVQGASASGHAHCRSSDASQMQAERGVSFFFFPSIGVYDSISLLLACL